MIGRTNAGEHQQLRRIDDAARHYDLARGARLFALAVTDVFDANGFASLEDHLRGVRTRSHFEVRPRQHRRKKRVSDSVTFTVQNVSLVIAGDVVRRRLVEVEARVGLETVLP